MKTELKAKFLQHLNKKRANKGFTLIELLVVIIIIGILAAIALPTFLNQTAKGKQAEAKQNISSINRTQTSFRAEKKSFATSIDLLALGTLAGTGSTASTSNYLYTLDATTTAPDSTSILATSKDTALKSYSGKTVRYVNPSSQSVMSSAICENDAPGTAAANIPSETSTAPSCTSAANTTAVE